MLQGLLTDPAFRAQLAQAIKPHGYYVTSCDGELHPYEVIMDGNAIRMGYIAWKSFGQSKRTRTMEAIRNN